MKSDATRLQRTLALFEAVADLPADERQRHLDEACVNDPELRAAVESLLIADRTADRLPTEPAAWLGGASPLPMDDNEDVSRLRFGPWQATGVLGHGGMGAVYRVERADGAYRQSAALKRIRIGLDSSEALQRFMRERQILATLRHPNIARLIDGGVAGETPYFAMELVEGERIDHWCDARKLPVRERVRLFLQVLDAVTEAHRNLVVHRDLKPSNVLVDANGQAHLLDFGIAQLLEEEDGTAQTQHRAFTPDFASPEQLRTEPVTTASDVYQLGVMLYLLVCGRHPFGIEAGTPWHRKIALLDKPAIAPSRPIGEEVAAARGGTPKSLSKQVSGDLEAIVLRAIAHTPTARYPSVDAFRSDLRAWLDGDSVQARLPGRSERLLRLIRRNRLVSALAVAVGLALAVGLGSTTLEARRAHRSETNALQQRALAEQNARQSAAIQETFERMLMHAMAVDGGRKTTVREMADGAMRSIDTKSGRGDSARISLLLDLIHVYTIAGQKDGAREMLAKVRPQALEMAKKQPVFAFRIKALEADLLEESDPKKIPGYRDAFSSARAWLDTADESSFEIVRSEFINYLYSLDWRGLSAEQYTAAHDIHAMTLARYGEQNPRTLQMGISHARALIGVGRHHAAEKMLLQQLALASDHFGINGQLATSTQSMLAGNDLEIDGHWAHTEQLLRDLLVKYQNRHIDFLGERKPRARTVLIHLLQRQRRDADAKAELAQIDQDLAAVMGDNVDLLRIDALLAKSEQAWNEGQIAESLAKAEAAAAIQWQPLYYDFATSHADALLMSARALAAGNRCTQAMAQVAAALKIHVSFPQQLDDGERWARAADVERVCGRDDVAIILARHGRDSVKRLPEPDSWHTGIAELAWARALAAAGNGDSISAFQRADAAFARILPANHPDRIAIAKESAVNDTLRSNEAPW